MVTAQAVGPTEPEWLRRRHQQQPASANRNINDIYWQKGPNEADPGWIIVGPSAVPGADGRPLTRQAEGWIRRGRTPLIEYSYTDRVSPRTGQRETIETNEDRLGTPDRYYWLFKNGGAHVFPIEQIVAHHWHINPPFGLPKSAFPQLEEWEVPEPRWCPACPGDKPPKNSDQEVVTHAMVDHRMTLQQANDLLPFAKRAPSGKPGLSLRRKLKEGDGNPSAASPDLPAARLHICHTCGESITGKLKDHECASVAASQAT